MKSPKVGDLVRFLNSSGGGFVTQVKGGIAYVRQEDGFEIPTPLYECVVVREDDSYMPTYVPPPPRGTPQKVSEGKGNFSSESNKKEEEPIPLPHLLIPEREEGDVISIYMAFLPINPLEMGKTALESYLINDCNYNLYFQLWTENRVGLCEIVAEGELERDTRIFLEEISPENLSQREKMYLSYLPFKREKAFSLKKAATVKVVFDPIRLIKRHTYLENDFFEEDAFIVPIVEKDRPKEKHFKMTEGAILEKRIREKLTGEKSPSPPSFSPSSKKQPEPVLEIDLHAVHLVTHPENYSPSDLLKLQMVEFRKVMEESKTQKGKKIVFIHGKGEGVLRKAILDEIKKSYPRMAVQDASFKEYGFGATQVTIR